MTALDFYKSKFGKEPTPSDWLMFYPKEMVKFAEEYHKLKIEEEKKKLDIIDKDMIIINRKEIKPKLIKIFNENL